MESIMKCVVSLVSILLLMTAIELIAPDNGMKKYLKFVLGLILISVILSPIILLLSRGENEILRNISKYQNEYTELLEEKDKNEVKEKQAKAFKNNLEKNTVNILKKEFSNKEFHIDIDCNMDIIEMSYSINKMSVGIEDKGIKKVQKIEIDTEAKVVDTSKTEEAEEELLNIQEYLTNNTGVPKENIEVYFLK